MKRMLRILIEAGDHTCRATPRSPWCSFARALSFGQRFECSLFEKQLPEVNEDGTPSDEPAWLGRLPECKAAEKS